MDADVVRASLDLGHPGCARVISNPGCPGLHATVADVVERLRGACASPDHVFWPEAVSLLDGSVFDVAGVAGHQKITDACLLGLAVQNGGRLMTFDRAIPLEAVARAGRAHLELLGGGPAIPGRSLP